MSRKHLYWAIVLIVVLSLLIVAPALAKKGPPVGESSNNLSVPTIMIGDSSFANVDVGDGTPSTLITPSPADSPLDGYPIGPLDYYYVQGVHKWQCQAYKTPSVAGVTVEWGDNLSGDAKLKAGSPIRVELGLFRTLVAGVDPVSSMDGYTVVKLEPSALDRESAYGTLATKDPDTGLFAATPTAFTKVRVYDNTVTLSIKSVASGEDVVPTGLASAEINATGNVVYGYNLRVPAPGTYEITYAMPNLTITGTDAGEVAEDGHSVSLTITVIGGGGSGGGKNH